MIVIINQIKINKSRKVVFDFLSNFENIPLWNYYVKEVKEISPKHGRKRRYHQVRQNDFQNFEIMEELFPEHIIIETTDVSKIWFSRSFKLIDDPCGNCILEDNFEIDLGYPQILQQLFQISVGKSVKENLNKMKELLEFGNTVLQDGRISKLTIQDLIEEKIE